MFFGVRSGFVANASSQTTAGGPVRVGDPVGRRVERDRARQEVEPEVLPDARDEQVVDLLVGLGVGDRRGRGRRARAPAPAARAPGRSRRRATPRQAPSAPGRRPGTSRRTARRRRPRRGPAASRPRGTRSRSASPGPDRRRGATAGPVTPTAPPRLRCPRPPRPPRSRPRPARRRPSPGSPPRSRPSAAAAPPPSSRSIAPRRSASSNAYVGSRTPKPVSSTRWALSYWSQNSGSTIIGLPKWNASVVVLLPPWVMTRSTCGISFVCGRNSAPHMFGASS